MTPTVDHIPVIAASDMPTVSCDQMREVDRVMIHELGITLVQMMENAGLQLAELVRRHIAAPLEGGRVVVLAGHGNNGGGGLTAARRLSAWGTDVIVVLADAPERFRDVPAVQLGILRRMNVPASRFDGTLPDAHVRAYAERANEVRPLPGARALLERLTALGVPWAIATSGRLAGTGHRTLAGTRAFTLTPYHPPSTPALNSSEPRH